MLHKFGEYEVHTTRHSTYLGTRYRAYIYYKGRLIGEKGSNGMYAESVVLGWAKDEIEHHKRVLKELGRVTGT